MRLDVVERELMKIQKEIDILAPRLNNPEWETFDAIGAAAIIASIYSGYESIFRNLSKKTFQKSESWHIDLLNNAITEGIAPADMKIILKDLLQFRHVQRNHYTHELTTDLVRQKATEVVTIIVPTLNKHLESFIK
jgi:hypothetical protein